MKYKSQQAYYEDVEKFYNLALERSDRRVRHMVEDANTAHAYMNNPVAMESFTQAWGYSAKRMALAVQRHPAWFDEAAEPEALPSLDQVLALFAMAQLSEEKDAVLYARWEKQKLPAWRVREEVNSMKKRSPRMSHQVLVVPEAAVRTEVDPGSHYLKRLVATPGGQVAIEGFAQEQNLEVRLFERTEEDNDEDE